MERQDCWVGSELQVGSPDNSTQRKCQVLLQIMHRGSEDQLRAVGGRLEKEIHASEAHGFADADVSQPMPRSQ